MKGEIFYLTDAAIAYLESVIGEDNICISDLFLKRKNTIIYDLSGEYGIGYLYNGDAFYFDLENYEDIKNFSWHRAHRKHLYLVANKTINNKTYNIYMHRLVMGVTDKKLKVDHIHGYDSVNDNRKSNLRLATTSQNSMNKRLLKSNTSGVTGVMWKNREQKWYAKIVVNDKEICLGYYDEFKDAVCARKQAEKKYFGEFSYDYSQAM